MNIDYESLIQQHPDLRTGFEIIRDWRSAHPDVVHFPVVEIVSRLDIHFESVWTLCMALQVLVRKGAVVQHYTVRAPDGSMASEGLFDTYEHFPAVMHTAAGVPFHLNEGSVLPVYRFNEGVMDTENVRRANQFCVSLALGKVPRPEVDALLSEVLHDVLIFENFSDKITAFRSDIGDQNYVEAEGQGNLAVMLVTWEKERRARLTAKIVSLTNELLSKYVPELDLSDEEICDYILSQVTDHRNLDTGK